MTTELRYGLLFAGIVVVYVLIEHILGFNTTRHDIGSVTRLGGVIVPILGVIVGVRAKKRTDLNGTMTFMQGFKAGTLVAVTQTVLTTAWFLLYASYINPNFLETMAEYQRSTMMSQGMDESAIIEELASMRSMFAFPTLQIFQLTLGTAYGALTAGITSLILRTKQGGSATA